MRALNAGRAGTRPGGPTFGSADLDQVHHVLVLQQLQDFDLPQSRDGELEEPGQNGSEFISGQ